MAGPTEWVCGLFGVSGKSADGLASIGSAKVFIRARECVLVGAMQVAGLTKSVFQMAGGALFLGEVVTLLVPAVRLVDPMSCQHFVAHAKPTTRPSAISSQNTRTIGDIEGPPWCG